MGSQTWAAGDAAFVGSHDMQDSAHARVADRKQYFTF
jgi:hypothetical protein